MDEIKSEDSLRTPAVPGWIATGFSLVGEFVLVMVTIGIITAMWLPAYLTGKPGSGRLVQPAPDGPMGMPGRAR